MKTNELKPRDLLHMRRLIDADMVHGAAKILHGITLCGMSKALSVVKQRFPQLEQAVSRQQGAT